MKLLKNFLNMCALAVVGAMMIGCSSNDDNDEATAEQQNGEENSVEKSQMLRTPLTFEAIEDGTISFSSDYYKSTVGPVTYRINGGDAQTIAAGTKVDIPVKANDKVAFFGDNKTYAFNLDRHSTFSCTGDCYIYGNIMSLISSQNYATTTSLTEKYTFSGLFRSDGVEDNNHIKNHPTHILVLPATTLTDDCYAQMFSGCTSLTKAPELPATTLANGCYKFMFSSTSLSEAPKLPAKTLAYGCYEYMFCNCKSITKAPELPASKLASCCYNNSSLKIQYTA